MVANLFDYIGQTASGFAQGRSDVEASRMNRLRIQEAQRAAQQAQEQEDLNRRIAARLQPFTGLQTPESQYTATVQPLAETAPAAPAPTTIAAEVPPSAPAAPAAPSTAAPPSGANVRARIIEPQGGQGRRFLYQPTAENPRVFIPQAMLDDPGFRETLNRRRRDYVIEEAQGGVVIRNRDTGIVGNIGEAAALANIIGPRAYLLPPEERRASLEGLRRSSSQQLQGVQRFLFGEPRSPEISVPAAPAAPAAGATQNMSGRAPEVAQYLEGQGYTIPSGGVVRETNAMPGGHPLGNSIDVHGGAADVGRVRAAIQAQFPDLPVQAMFIEAGRQYRSDGRTVTATGDHIHVDLGPAAGGAPAAGLRAASSRATVSPLMRPETQDDISNIVLRGTNNIIPQGLQFMDMQAQALAEVYNELIASGRGIQALGVLSQLAQAHTQVEALNLEQDVYSALVGNLQPLAQRLANATRSNIEMTDNGDGTYNVMQNSYLAGTASPVAFINIARALLDRSFRETQREAAAQRAERQDELAQQLQVAYLNGTTQVEVARIHAAASQGGFEITEAVDENNVPIVSVYDRETGRRVRTDRFGEVEGPGGQTTLAVTPIG